MFGRAFEVNYVDEDSNPQTAKLDVYGTIVVYDNTYKHRKLFAINYAQKTDDAGKALDGQYDVTLWDTVGIYQYDLNKETLTETDYQQHFFGRVPVIEYFNDARLKGDYENVITLIDAYNILQSDRIIDREKLVDAILAIQKANLTNEDMQNIKDNRVMGLPEGAKAEYIIKQVNEADADVLRKVLAADIHKFSMTPDMSSDEFGGNGTASTSGVALKYRLLPFEDKAKNKQQYFEDGLQRRLELYTTYLKLRSIISAAFVPSDIEIVFKRSLPQNDLEISQMITNLDGLVDRTTLAGQLSFVKNASQVVDEAQVEDKALTDTSFGTNQRTGAVNGAPATN
jgi:SPP1 family phage portal protein